MCQEKKLFFQKIHKENKTNNTFLNTLKTQSYDYEKFKSRDYEKFKSQWLWKNCLLQTVKEEEDAGGDIQQFLSFLLVFAGLRIIEKTLKILS